MGSRSFVIAALVALVCLAHAAPQGMRDNKARAFNAKREKRTIWDRPHSLVTEALADNHMRQEGAVPGLTPPMQHKNLQRPVATASLYEGANDVLAGVPDSASPEFPEDVTFGAPCDEMVEEVPLPSPSPKAKEIVIAAPDYSFAKQVVGAIKEVCKRCGCKLCQNLNLTDTGSLVMEVYNLMPSIPNQTDICPKWLAANPNWPSLNMTGPSKMEEKIKTKAEQKADGMKYPKLKLTNSSDRVERSKYDVAKMDMEEKKEAEEQVKANPVPLMYAVPKQAVVPDDCADDLTGSGGLSNVEVAGSATGMNTGYAEAREKAHPAVLAAKPPRRRGYLDSVTSLLETSATASPCVEYEGMVLIGEQPLYEPKQVDVVSECIEACLFDDDCTGWTVNASMCALYNSDRPTLARPPQSPRPVRVSPGQTHGDLVSGLCPKAHLCPESTYEVAVKELTSAAGANADCPALLARLTTSRGPTASRCQCLRAIRLPTDNCFLSANAVTLADLHNDCRKSSHGKNGLIQVDEAEMQRMPDCTWTDVFSAGLGSCKTYSMDVERSNHVHCTTDFDVDFKVTAASACWQCGKCAPTPSPSAIIPPPELITSETLPNGDKTPCLSARQTAIKKMGTGPGQGAFIPQCFMDGTYMPTQCVGKYCWCVYTNGVEIPATRRLDTPEEKMSHCRPSPPMEPVYPAPAVIIPDPSMVVSRSLAKIMYAIVDPERICRRNRTTHLEDAIYSLLKRPGNFSNVKKSNNTDCPAPIVSRPSHGSTHASRYPAEHVLSHLVTCLVPPPVIPKGGVFQLPSESPMPSPTPSLSASPSLTPSASPSSPVIMCGDVACKDLGLRVHMHQSVPPGFCATCLDGTSGPCRSKATFGCYQYIHGTTCRAGDIRCADLDSAHHKGVRFQSDCPDYVAGTPKIDMSVTLDTPFATGWITTWGRTFSSALADVTEVEDLCGLTVFGVEEDTLATRVHVRITEKDLVGTTSEFNQAMAWIKSSVADGSFLKALNRRGVPAKALSALAFKVTPGKARLPESVNRKMIEKVVKLLAQMPDAQLVAGFQQFDKNKNGKISVKELKDVVKYLIPGAGATDNDISAMVELVDTNQDGEIGVQEMLAYLRPRRLHPELVEQVIKILVAMPEEAVVAGFKHFDSNGNEKLSADELKNVVNFLVPNSEVSDADLTAMIGSIETETDGEVSLGELLAFLTTKRVNVGVVDKLLEALVTIPEELIIMGFKHFDADGSGTLKKDEIKSVISFLMPSAGTTDADLVAVVDRLDSGDKDGEVSLPEIISYFNKATAPSPTKLTAMVGELRKVLGSMSPEQITHGFNLFDSNKNGKLSVGETKDAIKALIPGMPVPDGSVKALVSAMDTDADGQVSLPELMVAIRG